MLFRGKPTAPRRAANSVCRKRARRTRWQTWRCCPPPRPPPPPPLPGSATSLAVGRLAAPPAPEARPPGSPSVSPASPRFPTSPLHLARHSYLCAQIFQFRFAGLVYGCIVDSRLVLVLVRRCELQYSR